LLGSQQEFWWGELARLTLGRREPAEGAVVSGGRSIAIRLPALPNDAGCRRACGALIGKPIAGFAYSHGDVDQVTKELVRDRGFQWACSTHSAAVDPTRCDRFDLPRLQVMNWAVQELEHALDASRSDA